MAALPAPAPDLWLFEYYVQTRTTLVQGPEFTLQATLQDAMDFALAHLKPPHTDPATIKITVRPFAIGPPLSPVGSAGCVSPPMVYLGSHY